MTRIERPVVGSIALALFVGCGAQEATAPRNDTETKSAVASDQNAAPVEARPVEAPGPAAVEQPTMSTTHAPHPVATPRRPSPLPAASPGRDIRPIPEQPPAEVDPPHRYPGDEVPR